MQPLKTLALAALIALTAMAFLGASTAMGESTDLCTADENPCAEGNVVTHLHETSVGKAVILSEPTVECNVLFLGEAAGESGSIFNGKFTYSSCNNSCKVTEAIGSEVASTVIFLRAGTDLAEVTGGTEISVNCLFGFIKCIYNIEPEGHGLDALTSSSANGSTVVSKQEMEAVSGSCPKEAFLDLTTTPLTKTYITAAGEEMICVQVERGRHLLFNDGKECKELMTLRRFRGKYELSFKKT